MVRKPTGETLRQAANRYPVTISILASLVTGGLVLGGIAIRGSEAITTVAATAASVATSHHSERDVDLAHPELPKRYVQRWELKDCIHALERKQDRAAAAIEQLTAEVRHARRERGRGR